MHSAVAINSLPEDKIMGLLYGIPGLRKLVLVLQNGLFNLVYHSRFLHKVTVFGLPLVQFAAGSTIRVGKNLVLISHSYFSAPGVNHPVVIRLLEERARLTIGDNVGMSGATICVAREVVIGNNVLLGANVSVVDTDFHPIKASNRRYSHLDILSEPIVIEDNVFVGMNSLILKGVTIGKNSVIGAASVVTQNIPENSIAGGVPAKVLKEI